MSVNRELILLYHHIGSQILEAQSKQGWGAKVIDQLSKDLASEFPEMKGFSVRNLKYMRKFASEYPDAQFVQQLVAQLPWGHIVALIYAISNKVDISRALTLWDQACATRWNKNPVWIHGDFAIGNMLMDNGKLSAIIDFCGVAVGDPACDLVIAWTYLSGKAREIFIAEMNLDQATWLRARAWALWKATFELCQIKDKNSAKALLQKRIIDEVING